MPGLKDWIAKASADLRGATKLIKDDDYTLDLAVYHTHQVAEKALKAYLVFKQQPILRTHDLEKLLNECKKYDHGFDQLQEEVETLAPFAIYSRYPDDRFSVDREETIQAIKHAEKILKFVKEKTVSTEKSPQTKIFSNE